jgi:capsid protein
MLKWIDGIKAVIDGIPQVQGGMTAAVSSESVKHGDIIYEVTTEQKNRYPYLNTIFDT